MPKHHEVSYVVQVKPIAGGGWVDFRTFSRSRAAMKQLKACEHAKAYPEETWRMIIRIEVEA